MIVNRYSMFPQVPKHTHISALYGLDFRWFATHTNMLTDEYADVLQPYYDEYVRNGCKPFYNLSLAYNTMTDDRKFRFLLVTTDAGDEVFVPYKVIQILKTRQIRFFGFPMSKNKIAYNEKNVFEKLRNLDFTRFVFTSEKTTGKVSRIVEYDDYFYTLDDKTATYGTSRYRSKNYINKLLNDPDVRITFGVTPDNVAFDELRKAWKIGMNERGSFVSTVDDRHFAHITSSHNIDLRYLCVYHRDVLVSLQVFLCNATFQYADCLYIHHLWQSDDEARRKILGNIVEIQKYLSWEHLYNHNGITHVYIAGCRPSEHRLLAHKERISDGKVEYFIL